MNHNSELPKHLAELLPPSGFENRKVLIVGDMMLDRYIIGEATRISPEAPVPVVAVQREKVAAGGAGNVALNVAGLGARAIVAGVIADDVPGALLEQLLADANVSVENLVREKGSRPTTCKTRVMCGNHQLVRFDNEITTDLDQYTSTKLRDRVASALSEGVHAVILSDYSKGVCGSSFIQFVIRECKKHSVPVFVDPKKPNYRVYADATCLTPNWKEFQLALQTMSIVEDGIATAGQILRENIGSPMLLVTQGSQGMTLITSEGTKHFPALAEEVFDVSGAGDTVIATLASAIAFGVSPVRAVELSNIAASIVVRKVGTAPIAWHEFKIPSVVEAAEPKYRAHAVTR